MILIKLLMKGYSFKALWRNCKYWRRFMTSKHRPSHQGAITATQSDTHITLHAHVYVQILGHMYTCGYILWAVHMYTCNILQAHVYVRIYF